MTPFVEQAIPYEAGHIVVGTSFPWIPIRELAFHLYVGESGLKFGDFATASIEPSEAAIAITPPERMAEYELFVAAGLAGNVIAGIPAMEECLQSDRARLARVTPRSLEELCPKAMELIQLRRSAFDRLVDLIHQRFNTLTMTPVEGRHILLNRQQIVDIVNRR